MSHSPTPPSTPVLPLDELRQFLGLSDVKDRVGPELLAWLRGQQELAAWQAEEKKRDDFEAAVCETIDWCSQNIDTEQLRAVYDRLTGQGEL